MYKIITKGMVRAWLRKLTKQGILVAPTKLQGGDVAFKELFTPKEILLEFKQPLYSAKSFFLPREETLFTYQGSSVESLQEVYDQFPRIFFGLRPCDLKAITQADRFFQEGFQDSYYYHRRQQTLLMVVGCNNPEENCFCETMGLGPFYKDGADIFMVDLGAEFAVKAGTSKGKVAIEDFVYFFEDATKEQQAEIKRQELSALDKVKRNMPTDIELPNFASISDETWAKISHNCFSCGSCSYICPLCFCYNVTDRQNKDLEGKRVRTWDSCIFAGFTRMAGGHNLFEKREDRLKKRFAHKLDQYPKEYGFPGCSGCGRCTVSCPGKIGMKDVLKKLSTEVDTNDKK